MPAGAVIVFSSTVCDCAFDWTCFAHTGYCSISIGVPLVQPPDAGSMRGEGKCTVPVAPPQTWGLTATLTASGSGCGNEEAHSFEMCAAACGNPVPPCGNQICWGVLTLKCSSCLIGEGN